MHLEKEIKDMWNKYATENFDVKKVYIKKISNPQNPTEFYELFFLKERLQYIQRNKDIYNKNNSPFQSTLIKKDNINFGNFILSKNLFPWQKYQIIIISKKYKDILSSQDIKDMLDLSLKTNYQVMHNLKGSGASTISHLHFQGFLKPFPAISSLSDTFYIGDKITLSRLAFPCYSIKYSGNPHKICEQVFRLLPHIEIPYNLLIYRGHVNVIPRPKDIPEGFGEWDFGGAEVSGVFFPRTMKQFNTLTYQELQKALLETSLTDFNQIQRLEDLARNIDRGGK